jgi:hypothetical protein
VSALKTALLGFADKSSAKTLRPLQEILESSELLGNVPNLYYIEDILNNKITFKKHGYYV